MGKVSRNIAVIGQPRTLSLASSANFLTIESRPSNKTFLELEIKFNQTAGTIADADLRDLTRVKITDYLNNVRTFEGTREILDASGAIFLVGNNTADNAENLKNALLSDAWIAANFDIKVPFVQSSILENGDVVHIKSKGASREFKIAVSTGEGLGLTWKQQNPRNNDSISGENASTELEIDVYADTGVFMGVDDSATDPNKTGTLIAQLQKAYNGAPIWFNVNAVFAQDVKFEPPASLGWFDPKTVGDYRVIAKVKAENSFPFYLSDVLFAVNGFARPSETLDLNDYVYTDGGRTIKLLTNRPRTEIRKGQSLFLNFLYSDPLRGSSYAQNFSLSIGVATYKHGGAFIGRSQVQFINRRDLNVANACAFTIDSLLSDDVAEVRVGLYRGGGLVSNELEFDVLPECFSKLRQIKFLNKLGGWDTFNFENDLENETKLAGETYSRGLRPNFKKGDAIEVLHSREVKITYKVESELLTPEVSRWLLELAASKCVIDDDGDQIIIDEITIPKETDEAQKVSIKYHKSETFNNY